MACTGEVAAIFNKVVEATTEIFNDLRKAIEEFVEALGVDWCRNQGVYLRSRAKAQDRSRRNNQTVKRYKHGRTQRTRVKR